MKKIAVVGAGGLGCEVRCLIDLINDIEPTWDFIGFFDDDINKLPDAILGTIDDINLVNEPIDIVIAIGDPNVLKKIVRRINNPKVNYPNIIAPQVVFYNKDNLIIGKGNIIAPFCTISTNVKIGDFNLMNGKVSIGHDSVLSSYNILMPAVSISGNVTICDNNFFGVGSIVLQGVNINSNIRLGSGSILMRSAKKEGLYVGNPAMLLKL